jgi:hypothetical protein
MKTTIDIPDDLYRKVKAKSALLGKRVREVTIELYRQWLELDAGSAAGQPPTAGHARGQSAEAWLEDWLARADAAMRRAPEGLSAREILEHDRGRLEKP